MDLSWQSILSAFEYIYTYIYVCWIQLKCIIAYWGFTLEYVPVSLINCLDHISLLNLSVPWMSREIRSGHSCYPMREISDNVMPLDCIYFLITFYLNKCQQRIEMKCTHHWVAFCSVVVQRHLITSIHSVYKEQVPPVSTSRIGSRGFLGFLHPQNPAPRDCLQMLGPEHTQIPCTNLQENL